MANPFCARFCRTACWRDRPGVNQIEAWRCRVSATLSVLSLVCVGLGLFLSVYIESTFKSTLEQQVVCSKTHCDAGGKMQWESFSQVPFPGSPQVTQTYYFYNLTNLEDVANGQRPHYDEIGPFVYNMFREKLDISFFDDGNKVSYKIRSWFEFDPEKSVMLDTNAIITQINPAYMGVMLQTQGELQLVVAAQGPVLREALNFLTTTFANDVISNEVPVLLEKEKAKLMSSGGEEQFLDRWANATHPPTPDWIGMVVSSDGRASGISLDSARKLWDPVQPFSLANVSRSSTQAWTNPSVQMQQDLQMSFSLTTQQVGELVIWRNAFSSSFATPFTLNSLGVETVADIGWKQWCDGTPSQGVSVRDLYPEVAERYAWDMAPEVGVFASGLNLPVSIGKKFLNGSNGVFDPKQMGLYISTVAVNANYSKVEELWGLNATQEERVTAFLFAGLADLSDSRLHKIFEQGGGLFASASVYQWLWDFDNPLLELLQPNGKTKTNLNHNQSEADALATPADSYYTGKEDVNQIGWQLTWNGKPEVSGFAEPITVTCTNEWGMFVPFQTPYQPLCTFNPDYARPLEMIPFGETELNGVRMVRYGVSNMTFAIDPKWFQQYQGFANMTGIQNAPVFQSNPHMMGTSRIWREKFTGIRNPTYEDFTEIDIEPITGKVMIAKKMLQVNVFAAPDLEFNWFNLGVPSDMFYPLMYAIEGATMTEANGKEIRDKVYLPLALQKIGGEYMIPIGTTVLIIAIVELIVVCAVARHRNRSQHSALLYSRSTVNPDDEY